MSSQSGEKYSQAELVEQMLKSTEQSENSLKTAASAQKAVMLTEENWKNLIESNQALIQSQNQLALILKELATKTELDNYIVENEAFYYSQYNMVNNSLTSYLEDFTDAKVEMENAKRQTADDIKQTLKDAILNAGREKDFISYKIDEQREKSLREIASSAIIRWIPELLLLGTVIYDIILRLKK